MESQKRQINRLKAEEEHRKRMRLEEEEAMDDDDHAGRSLRRRKPVNYTEKDEDISDLFEDKGKPSVLPMATAGMAQAPIPVAPKNFPRLVPNMPPLSDISDASDDDTHKPINSPITDSIAVTKVIDQSKGLLKLKITRSGAHSSTPPHPMAVTPQHTSSSYHSPSRQSPLYSPHSHSTSSLPPSTSLHYRSKSSSGSEKESKHKKSTSVSRSSRAGSTGIQDISDPDEPIYEIPYGTIQGSIGLQGSIQSSLQGSIQSSISNIPQLYSPGGESSGSDSNPHRKSLKLKLKLTPKDSTSEGEH